MKIWYLIKLTEKFKSNNKVCYYKCEIADILHTSVDLNESLWFDHLGDVENVMEHIEKEFDYECEKLTFKLKDTKC